MSVFKSGKPSAASCNIPNTCCALLLAGIMLSNAFSASVHAEEVEVAGRVASVTVYRDQARVIREVDVPASNEPLQIRVPDLPPQVIPQSWFTESDEGTDVLSLQVMAQEKPETADAADDQEALRLLHAKQAAVEQDLQVIEQDLQTLDQLVTFSADKVRQNLDRATLDVQSVTALADFTMERRRALSQEQFDKRFELEEVQRQISGHRKKRAQPRTEEESTYEALMTVQSGQGGTVRLAYDVYDVSWNPRYKIDGTQADEAVFSIQMEAVIVQNSGEAWNNVALTLATSTPQTQAAGPSLAPLRINTAPASESQNGGPALGQFGTGLQADFLNNELASLNFNLNMQAGMRQIDELTSTAEIQRKLALDAASVISDETYVLAGNVTLDSVAEPQTVSILRTTIQGELYHVATPLLSSFAFREASLMNESGKSLIAGPADVYLDKKFVGRVQVPPTAAGQKLTIGFGSDRQVRTRRELLSRSELIKGGNRRSELLFRLVVSNYHPDPIEIRLLDRIPISAKDDSINLTLSDEEMKRLSEDALYRRMQLPTGILRWDVNVPGKQFGSDAYDHEYGYSVEHDREQTLASEDLAQRMREDLQFQESSMGGGFGGGGAF